jgi:hypothetical protein
LPGSDQPGAHRGPRHAPGAHEANDDAAPRTPSPDDTLVDTPAVTDDGNWEELQQQHRKLPREERRPEFQPANDVERGLLRAAAANDHDLFLQTLADAEVLLPVPEDMDYTLCPGRPGFPWQTAQGDGTTVVPMFTSPERLAEAAAASGAGTDSIRVPFTSALRYWPDLGWSLAVNSGSPAGGTIQAGQLPGLAKWADERAARRMAERFEPQNDIEQRLFDAARRRDTDAFFKVLLGAQVLVPAEAETPWGIAPEDDDFPWRPVPVHGRISIQVFTSLKWMNEAIGSSRFVMPSLLEMVTAWPDAEWTLVLNPGTPIDATMPGEQVKALSGPPRTEEPPAAEQPAEPEQRAETAQQAEPEAIFEPGNRIDQELYEAALSGDSDAFLRVLLAANVLVPIPVDAPLEVTPIQREFRWEAALRGDSAVQVFTSLVRLREVLPESRFVYADFRELIGAWPRVEWAMLLNPGTRIGASLRGDQVQALSEWAVRVGLIQPRPDSAVPPAPRQEPEAQRPVREVPEPTPEEPIVAQNATAAQTDVPVARGATPQVDAPEAGQDDPGGVREPAAYDAPQPQPYRTRPPMPTPEADLATQPTVMQKVVPHGHVTWYLEQGYDRVGGFVYPTADVADLQTPVQLYEALGLLYEESPFSPADDGVYVIRWPAYCSELYRIPFGGQSEEDLESWGDSGWVIERAPFDGGGFAPGSAGSIREYKVDSVRLPYGAEMYYLGIDRSERFVAMYDPDRLAWLRPEAEAAASGPGADRTEAGQ